MFKSKIVASALLSIVAVTTVGLAQAHPRWVLPAQFVFSNAQGDWGTFDVSASNHVFLFDKPASADSASIMRPEGKDSRPSYILKGKRRSSFDYFFDAAGTYKVSVNQPAKYWTRYTDAQGEKQWLNASKFSREQQLPEGASAVSTKLYFTRTEAYITQGEPTQKVRELAGKYLEVSSKVHPNDLVLGEPLDFTVFLNGEVAPQVEVELIQEGTQYRDDPKIEKVLSDAQGNLSFNPTAAGRYLLKANYEKEVDQADADALNYSVHLTLEVQGN